MFDYYKLQIGKIQENFAHFNSWGTTPLSSAAAAHTGPKGVLFF
jgi:hypothetical protein